MQSCVVIPTFDNARTLEAVVRGALAHGLPVLVVDDGSTDTTPSILEAIDGIETVTHDTNRGKGAALRTGLRVAGDRGYTHAITLDSDGQHAPEDIPKFETAIAAHPASLVLGSRELKASGAGMGSRFGRAVSNFWTWVETGLRLPDTQTGFRVYPVVPINDLALRTSGYDFEIEVLVKAAWTGIEIRSVPIDVRYFEGEERVSHLRPIRDFLVISLLNTRLVTQRLLFPAPYLAIVSLERFRRLPFRVRVRESLVELFLREPGSPRRIALSVGLGLFIGLTPFWGFQIMLVLLLAHALGASKPVALAAAHVSLPPLIPAILYGSLVLGRSLLGYDHRPVTSLELEGADFGAWVVGSFALATIVATLGTIVTYAVASWYQRATTARDGATR